MTLLAHVGHWAVSLLYVAPVLIVVVALAVQSRRERGRPDEYEEGHDELDLDAEPDELDKPLR